MHFNKNILIFIKSHVIIIEEKQSFLFYGDLKFFEK